MPPRREDF